MLLTHGYTSSHHMAGRTTANGAEGSWDGLVGPGKAIDTDRLYVVSSNMLGSSYGSTYPASKNPATGKPYGPDFPDISLVDSSARRRHCSTASASSTWSRSRGRRSAATRPSSGASPTRT